jgi:hypothetical protein
MMQNGPFEHELTILLQRQDTTHNMVRGLDSYFQRIQTELKVVVDRLQAISKREAEVANFTDAAQVMASAVDKMLERVPNMILEQHNAIDRNIVRMNNVCSAFDGITARLCQYLGELQDERKYAEAVADRARKRKTRSRPKTRRPRPTARRRRAAKRV